MATFVEKEALIELFNGLPGTISGAVITEEKFAQNEDVDKCIEIVRELIHLEQSEIDFNKYKKIFDEMKVPYIKMIEERIGEKLYSTVS
ncbi:hypothetical protein CBLAS_0017 [Campylobacter blaseri]|uniref:Uncharacterized protein n=1 Tax=Campylobacter blaseri TaxID=2042961 RepID=A0A2P8R3I4_9BACT|nr:hypothetical protein [Campylobacter blaseri]PSM53051.1 hypothetical protein CQ405_00405 [Campylobacter blaseri]PSM54518.1 hypothetical protein CRN67_00405 [Campylobacter blaseri]QKF85235.1 hypothetical protein CBLAS_0017 [Campylobacter blaseri]